MEGCACSSLSASWSKARRRSGWKGATVADGPLDSSCAFPRALYLSGMKDTVAEETIAVPAEWAPQRAIWTAWPADPEQWNRDLEVPRRDVAALVRALAPNNRVRLLVNGAETEESARASLGSAAEIVP